VAVAPGRAPMEYGNFPRSITLGAQTSGPLLSPSR
jgi:hypothetical protein